jgi:radical SAM superfamily enzyme YgiQ (UPF0313 family)
MRVLLVYPKYPDTFWSFRYALKFVHRKASFPPLGLLTIASLLPKKWELRLADLNLWPLKDQDIEWADQVWISAMEVQKESVKAIVEKVKEHGKTIVAGGPMFTTSYEKYDGIDHLVLDEGEVTIPMFLKDLKNRRKLKAVYASKERPSLDNVPIPRWDLIDFNDYQSLLIQYSRGCPFNCDFCNIAILNGRAPRTKSAAQTIKEVQSIYDIGYRGNIFFVDDNFIGNRRSVRSMLRDLIEWQKEHRFPFTFLTEASVDLSDDDELLNLMVGANFNKVFLGIETPDRDSLKECNKLQNAHRDLEASIEKIHKSGLQVMGGFIVGFDNDNLGTFDRQIDFIQRTGITTAMVGLLNAPPGTPLWNRLKGEGRLIGEATGSNTDGTVNFVPKMDREELIKGYKRLIKTIYSYKNYYKRVDKYLKYYRPKSRGRIKVRDVMAFFRSVVWIGIFSTAAIHYWKMIVKTIAVRRHAFPMAIELAIYGLNFKKTANKLLKSPI